MVYLVFISREEGTWKEDLSYENALFCLDYWDIGKQNQLIFVIKP